MKSTLCRRWIYSTVIDISSRGNAEGGEETANETKSGDLHSQLIALRSVPRRSSLHLNGDVTIIDYLVERCIIVSPIVRADARDGQRVHDFRVICSVNLDTGRETPRTVNFLVSNALTLSGGLCFKLHVEALFEYALPTALVILTITYAKLFTPFQFEPRKHRV